ncbi:MAG: glycosyltransferase family 2 protein [Candidatus Andersenbacteria bacterium]
MSRSTLTIEIDPAYLRKRLWQIIPGLLSWTTLIGLTVMSFALPFWVAIFIIAYDVYLLVRIVYMTIHLLYAYRRLKEYEGINWIDRCKGVSENITAYEKALMKILAQPVSGRQRRQVKRHYREVRELIQSGHAILDWKDVQHAVVVPTYDESLIVLRSTINALVATTFPKERMHIAIGFEERAGQEVKDKAATLQKEFGHIFGTFLTTFHPDGLPGEKRVKSANASWAIQQLEKTLTDSGVAIDHIVVSNFDSDTVVQPEYFSYLTYSFITHEDRYRLSYQPIPVYSNNLWDAPAFSRVIAMGSTFWQMIESTRPERLVTFSSHSMTLKTLREVGYWQKDIVSEDSRIFWQALLHYDGNYRTEPLYVTVSMDAALAPSWWQTLKNQYKQKRRWAWGIENFPFLVEGFWANKKIPLTTKWVYLFRTLEGHYSWATAAIIVAGLGWLPVIFGGASFHSTVLSYSLPFVTRSLMTVAMSGLIISATLTLLLVPRKSESQGFWKYSLLILQWVLVPLIATLLSAFPALDSETRLMLGRDLHFNVMQKTRREKGST